MPGKSPLQNVISRQESDEQYRMSDHSPQRPDPDSFPRSPELMNAGDTALLVVDVQERIVRVMPHAARLTWNIRRLIDGAKILSVAMEVTEQAPDKLGPTVPELAERLPPPKGKLAFSCCQRADLLQPGPDFLQPGSNGPIHLQPGSNGPIHRVLLCGVETHVCVQQTALDLMAAGYRVYAAVDALASRHAIDHDTALRRMESSGVTLTTCESALMEWAQVAGTPEFKQLSALAKEPVPEEPFPKGTREQ